MNVIAIIPSRYASSRFPGKPLALIGGKSMIQRVYERVNQVERIKQTIVATDDKRIFKHVKSFGGLVEMTSDEHQSGTDRCAEVAENIKAEIVINIQGDEPFLSSNQIDILIDQLIELKGEGIATLAKRISDEAELNNPSIVKVVMTKSNQALYFSRSPIPYLREKEDGVVRESNLYYKHIGIYGFYRKTLLAVAKLERTKLEKSESLEQLRWLENGFAIQVGLTKEDSIGIDTPQDLTRAEEWINKSDFND